MIRWKVGGYLRLSHEDEEKHKEESNSIANQRDLIDMFLKDDKNLKIVDYYIDDGFTGTDFNRPGFQRLLTDIKNGKINAVVVKDLSRLGRNYIEVGNYIEQIFPLYDIRFIAINDKVDSFNDPQSVNNILVPFKNVMNDEYARDISKKVRSTFDTSRETGKFIGISAPYGYLKNPLNKYEFIIDKKVFKIVQKMFSMALSGNSREEICDYLNMRNILPPAMYKMKEGIINSKVTETINIWKPKMVDRILQNRAYTGDLIQKKRKRVNNKVHKLLHLAEEDWIIYSNHHEALVTKDVFDRVQELLYNNDMRINKEKKFNALSGCLHCLECGNTLTIRKAKNHEYYYCTSYIKNKTCTKHTISKDKLEEQVLKVINHQIYLTIDINEQIEEVVKKCGINYDLEILKSKIKDVDHNISKYEWLKKTIREDLINEYISDEEFSAYEKEYTEILSSLYDEKNNLEGKVNDSKFNVDRMRKWVNDFIKNKNITNLTKGIVNELIEDVCVDESGNVKVIFRYEDEFSKALNFINEYGYDIITTEVA